MDQAMPGLPKPSNHQRVTKTDRALVLFIINEKVPPDMLRKFGRPANLVSRLRRRGYRIKDYTVGGPDFRTRLEYYYYAGWKKPRCRDSKRSKIFESSNSSDETLATGYLSSERAGSRPQ
jgi:hypothetical protein